MIHGITITVQDSFGKAIPIEELSKSLLGFPYKFISPKAHRYYVEFSDVQMDETDFVDYLQSKGLQVVNTEPSFIDN